MLSSLSIGGNTGEQAALADHLTVAPQAAYLTPAQVSERLGKKTGTLSNWRSKGKGPAFKRFGHHVYYPTQAVLAYEDSQTLEGAGS